VTIRLGMAVAMAIADAVAMAVADSVAMAVADSVAMAVAVTIAVAIADAVAMAVGVLAGQSVGHSVGRTVGVAVGVAVGRSVSFEGASFLVLVGFLVEVGEEAEEENSMATDPPNKGLGVVAVDKEQLEGVHHNSDELDHLEGGEVFLPPDELLVLGSHGGDHVIKVHDDVDERVEQAEEGRVTAGSEANAEPHAHRHDTVVHHVQQRDVLLFLAQHEEERIEEFCELGEVVPPASVDHPRSHGTIGVIHRLATVTIPSPPARHPNLVEEPRAEDDLDEVVGDQ